MRNYSSLLEAFEALNERKRVAPESLTKNELARWKEMRREIEKALFQSVPDPATDTREFLRVPVSLAVRYWTQNEMKDRYIPILGEGGLFVSAVDPLPVGSELDLEIVLARKGLSFKVKGEVVWVNAEEDPAKRGMGIKFTDLAYEQKRNIYSLVDDTLRQRLLERRRFGRVDARLQVKFVYAEGFFGLRTEDLSLGGMFIATDHLVPVGEKIRLVLHVPGGQPAVNAVAKVVRVVEEASPGQPAGLGVSFIDLDDESGKIIQSFLGLRVSGEHKPSKVERRRFPRVERRVKLRFQSMGSFKTTYARDISRSGVFIHTHDPPHEGSQVEVSLVHPITLQKLELLGKVVRVVEPDPADPGRIPGVGVSFEGLNEEQSAMLHEFLKTFALLEHIDDVDQEVIEESS